MWFFVLNFILFGTSKSNLQIRFRDGTPFSKCFFSFINLQKCWSSIIFPFFTNSDTLLLLNWKTYETLFCKNAFRSILQKLFLSRPMDINSTGQQPNFLWHIGCCCCCEVVVVVVAGEGEDEDWIISLIPKGRTLFHSTRATEEMVEDQFNTC